MKVGDFDKHLARALGVTAKAAPEPVAVDVRRAPVYRWAMSISRDADGRIVAVDMTPVARITVLDEA
jgi:hypothetical protein